MRTWVEKLANIIKTEGRVVFDFCVTGNKAIAFRSFECNIRCFSTYINNKNVHVNSINHLEIINKLDNTYADIKLYDDESDLLENACTYCINKSQDNFMKQIENLE